MTSDRPSYPNPHHERAIYVLVATLLVLNLLDAVFTLAWLEFGLATEANPVMASLLRFGPVPFVAGKIVLVSLGSYLLWRRRRRPLSVVALTILFLAYYYLLLYHLRALNLNLSRRVLEWLGL